MTDTARQTGRLASTRVPDAAFARLVRDALLHLHDLPHLQTHPLAARDQGGEGARPAAVGRLLQQRLVDTIASLGGGPPSAGGSSRVHELLRLRYVEALAIPAVRDRLGIGQSEYFREHRRGLAAVTSLLAATDVVVAARPPVPSPVPPSGDRGPTAWGTDQAAARGNLPDQLTSFVGRAAELAEVRRLLSSTRVLTLTGTGGCGKTRLAIEAAAQLVDAYPGGVWFVDLASVADGATVPQVVATALGFAALDEVLGRTLTDSLVDALRGELRLLVMDNCEHLVAPCALLVETLLRACPRLTVLATSRERLGAAGEVAWRVPSLSVPPSPDDEPAAMLEHYESVRLFVDRARLVRPGFSLAAADAAAVSQICRRLDGIPLAIELAAARTRVLTTEQIAARLDDRFHLLTGGARTALRRQQTLRATLDWSHDLLSETECALLRRVAVFVGGWTLDAVEGVCRDPDAAVLDDAGAAAAVEPPRPRLLGQDVLDHLTGLADKSLVSADEAGGEIRYRLNETLRQYAGEKLVETGEDVALRDCHLSWYLGLAERAAPKLIGPEQVLWLDRLEAEHENLRAALDWALGRRDGDRAVRLAAALGPFWEMRGHLIEGTTRLAAVIEASDRLVQAPNSAWARVLGQAAQLTALRGDTTGRSRVYAQRSLETTRALGDAGLAAGSVSCVPVTDLVDCDVGTALLDETLATARLSCDGHTIAAALWRNARHRHFAGETAAARPMLEEALPLARTAGDLLMVAYTLEYLGVCAYFLGDVADAERWVEESLQTFHEIRSQGGIARNLRNLARIRLGRGDLAAARDLLARSVALHRSLGSITSVPWVLESFAGHAALAGDPARSLRLAGAAAAMRAAQHRPMPRGEESELAAWLDAARSALANEHAATAWQAGQRLSWEEAVEVALND